MDLHNYQEWIAERQRLIERIKELEAENAELKKRLGEDVVHIVHEPTANIMPLGDLSKTSESKPWEVPVTAKIEKSDFSSEVVITRSNMLYIPLNLLSSKVLNHLRRIASFRNPEFYSKQALRLHAIADGSLYCQATIAVDTGMGKEKASIWDAFLVCRHLI